MTPALRGGLKSWILGGGAPCRAKFRVETPRCEAGGVSQSPESDSLRL